MFENYLTSVEMGRADAEKLANSSKILCANNENNSAKGNLYDIYLEAPMQLFGNENNSMIPKIVNMVSEKKSVKVVGVAASGDWQIDAIAAGVRNILSVDVNKYQVYMIVLKFLAHLELSYNEFNEFLVNPHSPKCFEFNVLEKVFSNYNAKPYKVAFAFWKKLYECVGFNPIEVRKRFVAFEGIFLNNPSSVRVLGCRYLCSANEYEASQKKLRCNFKRLQMSFENDSILNQDIYRKYTTTGKFDILYLSNTHNFETPQKYAYGLAALMKRFVKKFAVLYSIQLSAQEVMCSGPMNNISTDLSNHFYTQVKGALMFLGEFGFGISSFDVTTCGGFSTVFLGQMDSVWVIKN